MSGILYHVWIHEQEKGCSFSSRILFIISQNVKDSDPRRKKVFPFCWRTFHLETWCELYIAKTFSEYWMFIIYMMVCICCGTTTIGANNTVLHRKELTYNRIYLVTYIDIYNLAWPANRKEWSKLYVPNPVNALVYVSNVWKEAFCDFFKRCRLNYIVCSCK